ncbi:MAG: helix-turn-helix transcriptional regulator [Oscillibacter sp.]|nr:helix-turn-helix transcriptional regulator [Oscillibacter sp.]
MFSKQIFAQRLTELRKLHHEKQSDLGEALGVKQTAICEMERGRKTTTAEKISLICRHYHVSADYLLGLSDDMNGGCERWTEDEE